MAPTSEQRRLTDAVDPKTLQLMQDTFAKVAGAIVFILDAEGQSATKPSSPNALADLLLETPQALGAHLSQARGLLGSLSGSEDVVPGPMDGYIRFAAPIRVEQGYLGAIFLGSRSLLELPAEELQARFGIAHGKIRQIRERSAGDEARDVRGREMLLLLAGTLSRLCQQQRALRERLDELHTVYDVSSLLAGNAPLDELLSGVTQRVAQVLEVAACSIRLRDDASGELRLAASFGLSADHIQQTQLMTEISSIDREALQGKIVYVRDMQSDPRVRFPGLAMASRLHSSLACPMLHRGSAVGVIRIYSSEVQQFGGFDVGLVRAVATQVGAAVTAYRLVEERLSRQNVDRQLRLAGEVQRRMIPRRPPNIASLDIATTYETSLQVGGDFFDFYDLPNQNFGFSIADVAGKGAPAALLMVAVRMAFRIHTQNIYEITRILAEINRQLERDTLSSEFATAWYGVYDTQEHMLTYVNAGHEPALLLRDGEVRSLDAGGMVLGVDPQAEYEQEAIRLQENDVLLLFTDGASEAFDYSGEAFGRRRLMQALQRYGGLSAEDILRNLRMDIWRFTGLQTQGDDMTMVCIKVRRTPAAGVRPSV